MLQLIPYRDINGYLLGNRVPRFDDKPGGLRGTAIVKYIYCPLSDGLRTIDKCITCEHFGWQSVKKCGLRCNCGEVAEIPYYLQQTKNADEYETDNN